MTDDLPSLYAYLRWSDNLTIEAVRKLTPEQYVQEPEPGWASIRESLVHIAGATWIWSRRLEGEMPSVRPTAEQYPTLDDVARLFAEVHDAFDRLLPTLTPDRLAAPWTYRNLSGQEATLPLWAVYRHVVNHDTYHRGQVASKLRRFGVEPPITDLALWASQQTSA